MEKSTLSKICKDCGESKAHFAFHVNEAGIPHSLCIFCTTVRRHKQILNYNRYFGI